jgi:hypothetical protein
MRLLCCIILPTITAPFSGVVFAELSKAGSAPANAQKTSFSTLEELTALSDIIVKAEAVASHPREGARPYSSEYTTDLRVISVLKGHPAGDRVVFQHEIMPSSINGQAPEHADFEVGRSYIVFAGESADHGVYGQVGHLGRSMRNLNQSPAVVLAASDQQVATGKSVQDVIWDELNGLLRSSNPKDVIYAIRQFDPEERWLTSSPRTTFYGFSRDEALDAIQNLICSDNPDIAKAAIGEIGRDSPYMTHEWGIRWKIQSIAGEEFHLMSGPGALQLSNADGHARWKDLCAAADGKVSGGTVPSGEVRAAAIRALGKAQEPQLPDHIGMWASDPEPLVRAAAAILLNDFPGETASKLLAKLAADGDSGVRAKVALAAGFSRRADLLPLVITMISDAAPDVRRSAGRSLVVFPLSDIKATLEANRDDPDLGPEFVNILAADNPEAYLDRLMAIIASRRDAVRVTTYVPHMKSWEILFHYVKRQDEATLKSPGMARYLDALEGTDFPYSMQQAPDLCNFYTKHGMTNRAKDFLERFMQGLPPALRDWAERNKYVPPSSPAP